MGSDIYQSNTEENTTFKLFQIKIEKKNELNYFSGG